MKQITNNYNIISYERGWDLFWLCTGIFAPSQSLLSEVEPFLKTRRHPLSIQCYIRLQKIKKYSFILYL